MYSVPSDMKKKIGGLVYFDVKHIRLVGGQKAYQFTGIDHVTRMGFFKVYSRINSKSAVSFYRYVKEKLGVDKICFLGSDNGSEFLEELEKLLSEQGVIHVFSSPHSPKQNPYVERVIRTVIEDFYIYEGVERNITRQQKALDSYAFIYNKIRPHKSLNLDTPYERYVKISRSLAM